MSRRLKRPFSSLQCFRFEQSGSGGRSQLVISPVMEADTGDYECWAQADSATALQVKKILKVRDDFILDIY